MIDISDVVIDLFEYCRTQVYPFNLFGVHWEMTILQILLIPCVAGLTIRIVKHIYEIVNM